MVDLPSAVNPPSSREPPPVERPREVRMSLSPPWSLLPQEILDLILQRLDLPDCFTFHKVCRSWRSVFLERRRLTRPPPCMAVSKIRTGIGKIYSLHGGQILTLRSPDLKLDGSERTVGSSMGWLVIVRDYYLSHLLNPITNERKPLPSFNSGCIYHVALSTSPTSPDCILVVSGAGCYDNPLHAWCRLSDSEWKSLNSARRFGFDLEDMMFHQGKLYLVSGSRDTERKGNYEVYTFDPQPKKTGGGSIGSISKNNHWFKQRLVQSGSELLLVGWRYGGTGATDKNRAVILDVFKQADEHDKWQRVKSLGDQVLMMNENLYNHMEALGTQDLMGSGLEPNCIYFPALGRKELVKFSMAEQSCQQIQVPLCRQHESSAKLEWIVPQAW